MSECEGGAAPSLDYMPTVYLRLNLEGGDPADDATFFRGLVQLHDAVVAYALTERRVEIPSLAKLTDSTSDDNWLDFALERIVDAINVATGNASLETPRYS